MDFQLQIIPKPPRIPRYGGKLLRSRRLWSTTWVSEAAESRNVAHFLTNHCWTGGGIRMRHLEFLALDIRLPTWAMCWWFSFPNSHNWAGARISRAAPSCSGPNRTSWMEATNGAASARSLNLPSTSVDTSRCVVGGETNQHQNWCLQDCFNCFCHPESAGFLKCISKFHHHSIQCHLLNNFKHYYTGPQGKTAWPPSFNQETFAM